MLILNLVGVKHKEIFYYLSISLSGPNLRYLRIYSERLIKPDHGMANKVGRVSQFRFQMWMNPRDPGVVIDLQLYLYFVFLYLFATSLKYMY